MATILALRAIAQSAHIDQLEPIRGDSRPRRTRACSGNHSLVFGINGPLLVAAAHRFMLELSDVDDFHVVGLRMTHATTLRRDPRLRPPEEGISRLQAPERS